MRVSSLKRHYGTALAAIMLGIFMALPAQPVLAATITIDSDISAEVPPHTIIWGNAPGPHGIANPYPSGDPANNTLKINSGAHILTTGTFNIYGAGSNTANVTGNTLHITGGTISTTGQLDIMGGIAGGNYFSRGNTLRIDGGNISGNVIRMLGGYLGFGSPASSTGNTITISGGTFNATNYIQILGSRAFATGNATRNSVEISGGTFNAAGTGIELVGGVVDGSGVATYNTLTLSGSPQFNAPTNVFGGKGLGSPDVFTGNTLNIWNYRGSAVRDVQNFQNYNFILPANMLPGETMLTATGNVNLGNATGTPSTVTGVGIAGEGTPLQVGDTVTLLRVGSFAGTPGIFSNNGQIVTGQKGVSLLYDWRLAQTADALNATVENVSLNPRTKSLSEGQAAGLAGLTNAGTVAATKAIDAAVSASALASDAGRTTSVAAFAVADYQNERIDTGSHINVDSITYITGLAVNNRFSSGTLTLGAFFEGGWGDYDSYNSFRNAASVKGSGDTEHYGGGLLAKYAFKNGIYTDASFRMGTAKTDFSSGDIQSYAGLNANYETDSRYMGGHLGLGYVVPMNDKLNLDLSAKYIWTHMKGDSITLSTGDPVDFDDSESHRIRAAARLNWTVTEYFKPFIGAGYDHELDGDVKGTVYGHNMSVPSLKGGTGFGELGLSFVNMGGSGLGVDLSVQGYTGVREGFGGSAGLKWEF